MSEFSYFFCIDYGEMCIFEYDSYELLLEAESDYMKNNDDWYIIEGKIFKRGNDNEC